MTRRAARIECHWAAQLPSAVGTTLVPTKPDDSHTNLGWDPKARALCSHPVEGRRAGLRIEDLTLAVLDDASSTRASFPLDGRTIDEALSWLAREFATSELRLPAHDMPEEHGAPFVLPDRPDLIDLARRFAIAHEAIDVVARKVNDTSPVRCWPHHFDIATLITLGRGRTIGVGMSPGDGSYEEPYWYVTPWPYPPADADLPPLPIGHWHREGFTAAIMLGDEHPNDFFAGAIAVCRALLRRVSLS